MPNLIVLAGPNGAGKSTVAPVLLQETLRVNEFVNADAIARVQQRVTEGGHNVSEETIRRRYNSGIRNFFQLYRPLADNWRFYDNSNPAITCLIASGIGIIEEVIYENDKWENIKKEFS